MAADYRLTSCTYRTTFPLCLRCLPTRTWASSGSAPAAPPSGRCFRMGRRPPAADPDTGRSRHPLDRRAEVSAGGASIRADPQHWGALVTTHKMACMPRRGTCSTNGRAGGDLRRDLLHRQARWPTGRQRQGPGHGPARAGGVRVPDHFARSGGAALILGSGGAGTALSHQLGVRSDRPQQIICTALTPEPLDHARQIHERAGLPAGLVRYEVTRNSDDVDALLAELPPASLVVNATGMGKDRPGSPMSAAPASPNAGWSGSSTTADRWTSGGRRCVQQRRRSCRWRTAGATSCTAGPRRWRRSSASPMPRRDGGRARSDRGTVREVHTGQSDTAGDVAADQLGRIDYREHLFQVSPLLAGDELADEPASPAGPHPYAVRVRGDGGRDATGLGRRPSGGGPAAPPGNCGSW